MSGIGKNIEAHEVDLRVLVFPSPTIQYTMTPERFVLEIPVEALANLSQDAHTRMLDMLNAWILRHKPVTPKDKP